MKKAGNVFISIIIAILLIFSIVITISVLSSALSDAKVPNLFGKAFLSVQSDSMKGENGFDEGSLIIVEMLDSQQANELSVGDVITFARVHTTSSGEQERYLETHRIIENVYDKNAASSIVDGILIKDGQKSYLTQGDNTLKGQYDQIEVPGQGLAIDYTYPDDIIGKWTGVSVPKLGTVMDFLQSQMGFFTCIILPLLAFFIWQLFRFITTLNMRKKEEALAAVSASEEAIKQQAVEEFLAKQQADALAQADTAAPEAPAENQSE